MADGLEGVARAGLAAWVGVSPQGWDELPVLGTIGDELYLVEIDASNREGILVDIVDNFEADHGGLRIDIVFFGDAGGVFASSMSFLAHWPKSSADVPAEVFVDGSYKAAFTKVDDELVVSVRHALRPSGGAPRRQLRFRPTQYEEAMADLARESQRLRDDLVALAQQRAPQKVGALREAFNPGPTAWPSLHLRRP